MRILVVEDDSETQAYLVRGLRQAGHIVDHAEDGHSAVHHLLTIRFDAAVLDRNLPELDGLSVLKAVRAAGVETPILLLSALGHTDERVRGLKAGADDYMAKPFSMEELTARLEALQKRRGPAVATLLACGDLEMDLLSRTVSRDGRPIPLLPREFKLLEELLRHVDQVVTRTMLLERVWDYRFEPHTTLIDTHISRLRKKIDEGFARPLLHTLRGVGYKLSARP